VVLSWLVQEGVVAIPRSAASEHIVANGKMVNTEPFLSEEELAMIRALDGTAGDP
jgi:diketogulonate reductase-like aldo/keto reductase